MADLLWHLEQHNALAAPKREKRHLRLWVLARPQSFSCRQSCVTLHFVGAPLTTVHLLSPAEHQKGRSLDLLQAHVIDTLMSGALHHSSFVDLGASLVVDQVPTLPDFLEGLASFWSPGPRSAQPAGSA